MEYNKNIKSFNKSKGDRGEVIAVMWLEKNGFEIKEINHKNKHGEIDIIATKEQSPQKRRQPVFTEFFSSKNGVEMGEDFADVIYHFIEVKMRANCQYGYGREAVNISKQKRIRSAALYYLIENGLHDAVFSCFDVIEINGNFDNYQLEYIENCF